jgi:hypothetical protein
MSDKPSPPLVQDDRVVGAHIYVGTNVWFNHWLADPKLESFRYECPEGSFTARRRKGDYWNAYRKVKGKLRQEYLGKSPDLTQTKLIETARTLAMDNTEYWRMKYPRPGQPPQPSQESTGLYNHSPDCITAAQETKVVELEASLTVLRNSVEPLKRENERLREQIKEYREKLSEAQAEVEHSQSSTNSPDPAAILNRLRKERKKSKADLKDVELIVELLEAIAL